MDLPKAIEFFFAFGGIRQGGGARSHPAASGKRETCIRQHPANEMCTRLTCASTIFFPLVLFPAPQHAPPPSFCGEPMCRGCRIGRQARLRWLSRWQTGGWACIWQHPAKGEAYIWRHPVWRMLMEGLLQYHVPLIEFHVSPQASPMIARDVCLHILRQNRPDVSVPGDPPNAGVSAGVLRLQRAPASGRADLQVRAGWHGSAGAGAVPQVQHRRPKSASCCPAGAVPCPPPPSPTTNSCALTIHL